MQWCTLMAAQLMVDVTLDGRQLSAPTNNPKNEYTHTHAHNKIDLPYGGGTTGPQPYTGKAAHKHILYL